MARLHQTERAMTLDEFIAALNEKAKADPMTYGHYVFSKTIGPKYTRIVRETKWNTPGSQVEGRQVFCFVDGEGNIYKAAGWKAPAKGVRSTLATVDVSKADFHGAWLYR
jgi:hypothetical protein